MGKLIFSTIVVAGVFVLSAVFSFTAITFLFAYFNLSRGPEATLTYAFSATITPLYLSYLLSKKIKRKLLPDVSLTNTPQKRRLIAFIIMLYLLTWSMGVPAVHKYETDRAINSYKWFLANRPAQILEGPGSKPSIPALMKSPLPYIRTYISFPILPFIIVSYTETQTAHLSGLGRWDIHFWRFYDVVPLHYIGLWIS